MFEIASVAFFTLFATIGPIDIATLFAALTGNVDKKTRRLIAIRGVAIGLMILLPFAFFGSNILESFGITLPALRTAGGILLLLIGIDMVFAKDSGGVSTTKDEVREARGKNIMEIAVFPIATPLIAGPGTMGAVILLMAQSEGDYIRQGIVIAALVANLLITLAFLLLAGKLNKLLGVTGNHVISRVMGVLLCALAVQFVFDGIKGSGLV